MDFSHAMHMIISYVRDACTVNMFTIPSLGPIPRMCVAHQGLFRKIMNSLLGIYYVYLRTQLQCGMNS